MNEKHLLRSRILGVLIQDARRAAGKSQEACAGFVGLAATELAEIERGERPISLPELEAFAAYVGQPLDHFLGDQLLSPDQAIKPLSPEVLTLRNRIIGVLLRQARLKARKTLTECAAALGETDEVFSSYELGQQPVPLSHLETLAGLLDAQMETFVDSPHNPLQPQAQPLHPQTTLEHLPPELREFIQEPANAEYVRAALHLSHIPADRLRGIAETLLELTF